MSIRYAIGVQPGGYLKLAAILRYQRGVLVEQAKRFIQRLGGQEEGHLSEPQIFDGAPVVVIDGRAELRQRDVVACALAELADALA